MPHPAPSDVFDGSLGAATLRSHVEADEDEDDEDDEDDEAEDIAEQAEERQRLSAFVLKETSGESSDDEEDALDEDDDDDSSSVSSSGSTPLLKPADETANTAKRAVTFHSSVPQSPTPSAQSALTTAPVLHRKLMKPSSRQHKALTHHHSSHQSGSKAHAVRVHRRRLHTADSNVVLLAHDAPLAIPSSPSSSPFSSVAPALSPAPVADPIDEAPAGKPIVYVPASSVSRYALLVAILRRSDGRDKLIRTAYFGSNHARALVHSIHSQLSRNKRLSLLLLASPSSTSPVLLRLVGLASSFCANADSHLGRLSEMLGAARQLLRFGRWVYDLQSLSEAWQEWKKCESAVKGEQRGEQRAERATALLELINAFLCLLIDLMDDVEWLAEHRVLPSALSSPAGFTSAILWLTSVCIDVPFTLHSLYSLRGSPDGASERRVEQLSLLRYTGDLVYSGSLVAQHLGWLSEEGERWRVGDSGGLVSAVVSLYKLSRSESLHRSIC